MAFGYTGNFYGPEDTFGNLLQSQSAASPGIGYEAARLADPFGNERKQYQNKLKTLVDDPGSFSSSPFYKFAYDQGLNALQRKGSVRSGNKLAALMKYGQGMASQAYFPQANLLSTLSGATTGSPAAAGLSVAGAFERSQNLANLAAANKAKGSQMSGGGAPIGPQGPGLHDQLSAMYRMGGTGTGAPSGGYGGGSPGSSYYSGGSMPYSMGGLGPASTAGTGYVSSDYGTYDFGSPYSGDSYYTPSYGADSGYSDYSPYGYSDFGGGYDSGYSDYYDPGYVSDYGWDEF